jgi:hypothetical protein
VLNFYFAHLPKLSILLDIFGSIVISDRLFRSYTSLTPISGVLSQGATNVLPPNDLNALLDEEVRQLRAAFEEVKRELKQSDRIMSSLPAFAGVVFDHIQDINQVQRTKQDLPHHCNA